MVIAVPVRMLRVLLAFLGVFWLSVGSLAVTGVLTFGLNSGSEMLGALMVANGGALILAARYSLQGRRAVDYATVAVLLVNTVLSVTDEIGPLDAASLLLSGGALVALLMAMWRGSQGKDAGEGIS